MRIIKLSDKDEEMRTSEMVREYFEESLPTKHGGKFLLTAGRISTDGIKPGEKLVFTLNGDIVYVGIAASERRKYTGTQDWPSQFYPFYFLVDTNQIYRAKGSLVQFEDELHDHGLHDKNISQTQCWPHLQDSHILDGKWEELKSD